MNYETLTRYLAEYSPTAIAKNEAGEIDREQTTEYVRLHRETLPVPRPR